ncbi:lytic transglycosylase domain-containing protein [Paenibacillus agilis]
MKKIMGLFRKKRVMLLLFIGFLFILFFQSNWLGEWMYPIPYKDEITKHANKQQVDPLLVAAIIRAETNYQVGKKSHKGALGIMQLMPDTANWLMEKSGRDQKWSLEQLHLEADPSIELGTYYLHSLIKQYHNNIPAAVAAYNAGPGNVNKWLKQGTWDGRLETAKEQIPFQETRNYVTKVFHYYTKYKKVYGS